MSDKENTLQCEECKKVGTDVSRVICPYTEEIHEYERLVNLCEDCYEERWLET